MLEELRPDCRVMSKIVGLECFKLNAYSDAELDPTLDKHAAFLHAYDNA